MGHGTPHVAQSWSLFVNDGFSSTLWWRKGAKHRFISEEQKPKVNKKFLYPFSKFGIKSIPFKVVPMWSVYKEVRVARLHFAFSFSFLDGAPSKFTFSFLSLTHCPWKLLPHERILRLRSLHLMRNHWKRKSKHFDPCSVFGEFWGDSSSEKSLEEVGGFSSLVEDESTFWTSFTISGNFCVGSSSLEKLKLL